MTGTSVVDYKYVDLVKIAEKGGQDEEESGVCNLRLLVHDDRMEEDSWVNARLAGQLWPGPVIQFYVDNIVPLSTMMTKKMTRVILTKVGGDSCSGEDTFSSN